MTRYAVLSLGLLVALGAGCAIENRQLHVGASAGAGAGDSAGAGGAIGGQGGNASRGGVPGAGGTSGEAGDASRGGASGGGGVTGEAGDASRGGAPGGAGGEGGSPTCPVHDNVTDADGTCLIAAPADAPMVRDLTLVAGLDWELDGPVFVGEDVGVTAGTATAELVIEPGVRLTLGENEPLVINRGSRLIADGTAEKPIVFTSENAVGTRRAGDWAGIVINGRAPTQAGYDLVPTVRSAFGGSLENDDSGILRFVRIEFAGETDATSGEVYAGLTLAGVGNATIFDQVEIHASEGDGLVLFGGTADLKHVVVNDVDGNSIYWEYGYRGRMQYVVVRQPEDALQGIYGANNPDDPTLTPQSAPVLANVTLLGSVSSTHGILLDAGSGGVIYNSHVRHPNREYYCLGANGSLVAAELVDVFPAMVEQCALPLEGSTTNVDLKVALLRDITAIEQPDFRPVASSPLLGGAVAIPDAFFDATEYVGAMGDEDYTAGWVSYPVD